VDRSRIAAIPAFADLPEPELEELAAAVHELAVADGSTVVTVDAATRSTSSRREPPTS
jgi:hypothetical protein